MKTLTVSEAISAVRKNLDELGLNESIMYTDESTDNTSLDGVIARTLPEAINQVHLAAPAAWLEGVDYSKGPFDKITFSDGILDFSFSADFLRLVEFQAKDSPIVVTDVLDEASPEGRKQLNKYIRGRYDRPRLVRVQGQHGKPEFLYYTLKDEQHKTYPAGAIKRFSFVKEQFFSESATGYQISTDLRQNILDGLTAMVLAIYGENEKAKYFADKASIK